MFGDPVASIDYFNKRFGWDKDDQAVPQEAEAAAEEATNSLDGGNAGAGESGAGTTASGGAAGGADGGGMGESLQEASNLSPEEKMDLFNRGQRRENLGACKDDKLVAYHKICVTLKYDNARRQIEAEMDRRGIPYAPVTNQQTTNIPAASKKRDIAHIEIDFTPQSLRSILAIYHAPNYKDVDILREILDVLLPENAASLWDDANIARLILGLVSAIYFDKDWLVDSLKSLLIDNFNIDKDELKNYIKTLFEDSFFATAFNDTIKNIANIDIPDDEDIDEDMKQKANLVEAKRYVKRYYIRPQNVFCSNKEDILKALVEINDENCSVYSLKRLEDHDDVHLLTPQDIIYYYDDGILYDKNHVKVMDYDLFVKNEEKRKHFGNVDSVSDATFDKAYTDRLTESSYNYYNKLSTKEFKDKLAVGEQVYLGYNMDDYNEYPIVDDEQYADTEYSVELAGDKYALIAQVISHHGGEGESWVKEYNSFDELLSAIKELHLDECPVDFTDSFATEAFNLNYKSTNLLGESVDEPTYTCCICGEEFDGYGNNPEPVKHSGRCCDACNSKFVIPARLADFYANREDNIDETE